MTSICFVHAHPDDETIASGALIAHLVEQGHRVSVLTATRGEKGEVVPGPLSFLVGTDALHAAREKELATALALLGVEEQAFLGQPPARGTHEPRRYLDSGMQWVREGLAGPAEDMDDDALCNAAPQEIDGDLAAWFEHVSAEWVITYDADGGYGHPDHVLLHHRATEAAASVGCRVSYLTWDRDSCDEWFELEDHQAVMTQALRAHATQLGVEGDHIRHSGGQLEPIRASVGLKHGT